MRKTLLIAGSVLGVLLLVVIGLIIYAASNLNSIIATRRARILALVSDSLGRPVEVQDIKAALGMGVSMQITGVKIGDNPAFSQLPFVAANEVSGEVEFLPLLAGDVRLTKLVLKSPEVRILRDANGVLNVSTIGKGGKPEKSLQQEAEAAKAEGGKRGGAGALGSIAVKSLSIDNGTILYQDASQRGAPIRLTRVDFDLENFSANRSFDLKLVFAFLDERQNFDLSGQLGPLINDGMLDVGRIPVDLKLKIGPLLLDRVRTLQGIGGKIPEKLSMPDPMSLEATAKGTLDKIGFDANSDLGPSRVVYLGVFNKPAGTAFSFSATGVRRGSEIIVARGNLKLADLNLTATGLSVGGGKPLGAHLDTNRFDLAAVAATLAAAAKYQLAGKSEVHGQFEMDQGSPNFDGTVALAGVAVRPEGGKLPGVSNLNGNIHMTQNSAVIEPATFAVGSGHASFEARAESLKPLRASYVLKADSLKLAEFVPSRPPEAGEVIEQLAITGTAGGEMSSPNINAQIASSSGQVAAVAYHSLSLQAGYDGKRASAHALKIEAFGGSIAGDADAVLGERPQFNATLNTNQIDLQQALKSQGSKAADIVRGLLTGQIKVAGRGAKFDDIKPTLQGQGRMAIANGKLIGVNIVADALRKVQGLPEIGGLISPAMIARHPGLFNNPDTDLKTMSLSFDLAGPRITSHDITVETADYRVLGDGWFDMDRNIDLSAQLMLSRGLSDEVIAEKKNVVYLTDPDRQIAIPVVIRGALPKPSVQPDIQVLAQRAASHAIQREGQKLFKKLLGRKSGPLGGLFGAPDGGSGGSAPAPAAPTPAPNPFESLKGLFR